MEYEINEYTKIEDILLMAIALGNFELVKKLMPIADKKFLSRESSSLLYATINYRNNDKYKIFDYLAKIIDIDEKNEYGDTMLMLVIGDGEYNTKDIKHILKHVKNINLQNIDGDTALNILLYDLPNPLKNKHIKTIKLFLERGADLSIRSTEDKSAIDTVIKNAPNIKLLELLLPYYNGHICANDIYVMIYDYSEHDSLYDAVELLMPYIDDINKLDNGHTVLWKLKNNIKNQDIIDLFIAHGAI